MDEQYGLNKLKHGQTKLMLCNKYPESKFLNWLASADTLENTNNASTIVWKKKKPKCLIN